MLKEEGVSNETCVNEWHFLNVNSLIKYIEEGIVICVSAVHLLKAFFSIFFTEEGIVICFSDVQLQNE